MNHMVERDNQNDVPEEMDISDGNERIQFLFSNFFFIGHVLGPYPDLLFTLLFFFVSLGVQ